MGAGEFIHNSQPFSAPHSQSIYTPDYIINPHPRFAALCRNIRTRRGEKVNIRVPLFRDVNTPEFLLSEKRSAAGGAVGERPVVSAGYLAEEGDEIHMDCMAFGMGMCCLVSDLLVPAQLRA